MEEAKLLFFLKILSSSLIASLLLICQIEASQCSSCSKNIAEDSLMHDSMSDFENILKEQNTKISQEIFGSTTENRLFVFVSFSQGDNSIKQYLIDAKKYGAEVFLVGIPGGSLKTFGAHLKNLITENSAGIAIDEREFDKFNINVVPAIVLGKETNSIEGRKVVKFDKVVGHVSIKTALELFAKDGDLSDEADLLLSY